MAHPYRPARSQPIAMTPFTKSVLRLIRQIPFGKVATYGQIARLAGKPHAARGVGWILNSCTETHGLPWQRVVNSKGQISFPKKSSEYREQRKLLQKENVRFSPNDTILLETYGWKKRPKATVMAKNQPKIFS